MAGSCKQREQRDRLPHAEMLGGDEHGAFRHVCRGPPCPDPTMCLRPKSTSRAQLLAAHTVALPRKRRAAAGTRRCSTSETTTNQIKKERRAQIETHASARAGQALKRDPRQACQEFDVLAVQAAEGLPCRRIALLGRHGKGNQLHVGHLRAELGQAARHVIGGRDHDQAAIIVLARPRARLPRRCPACRPRRSRDRRSNRRPARSCNSDLQIALRWSPC